MPSKIAKLRHQAFVRQDGRCYYCGRPMCSGDLEQFAERLNSSLRFARRYLCTAEHLLSVQDGGKDTAANIVAACAFCNATRHRFKFPPHPEAYRRHVASRIRRGKWHPQLLLNHSRSSRRSSKGTLVHVRNRQVSFPQ